MAGAKIVETAEYAMKNPIAIIGFPDVGLVGSIAALHLVERLKMKVIGHIESDNLPPAVVVHDSRPENLIRIYGMKNIIVLISEFPLFPSIVREISDALGEWFKSRGLEMELILGGIPHPQRLEIKSPGVYGMGTTKEMDDILHKNEIKFFEEGIIIGANGVMLRKCLDEKIPALYLLAESHYNFPDPEAAASILTVLNKITGLDVDVKELVEKGEKIRINARDLMKRTREAMNEMQKSQEHEVPMMYR